MTIAADNLNQAVEVNFDGLVGLTHNYGGLSFGNLASANNKAKPSNPRQAALEGLEKAWGLKKLGLVQGFLPPQERPFLPALRRLGFSGIDKDIFEKAWQQDKNLIANISAASSMWAANAATISPSADCFDGRFHATPANLHTMTHRAIEAKQTKRILSKLFENSECFEVHNPLPSHALTSDEGAANHNRMCGDYGAQGLEIFVYGRDGFEQFDAKFPARQTLQTGEAIVKFHGLDDDKTIHIRQGKKAIEAGAFHNDVVAVTNKNLMFFHEYAFENKEAAIYEIQKKSQNLFEPIFIEVPNDIVPINDAVKSYLFNTQLVERPNNNGLMSIIAPMECYETLSVKNYFESLIAGNSPICEVRYVDVRGSMNNGGGPACLRLRVVLTLDEIANLGGRFLLSENLYNELKSWINRHYRDILLPEDLGDYKLLEEGRAALDELTQIMELGDDFYDFQRVFE